MEEKSNILVSVLQEKILSVRRENIIMTEKVMENNQVSVMGTIVSDFEFSHQIFGEGFYMVDIMVERLSESSDLIPLMVSERLIDVAADYKGYTVAVTGQFRSYN